jgi:hypothetical protein
VGGATSVVFSGKSIAHMIGDDNFGHPSQGRLCGALRELRAGVREVAMNKEPWVLALCGGIGAAVAPAAECGWRLTRGHANLAITAIPRAVMVM